MAFTKFLPGSGTNPLTGKDLNQINQELLNNAVSTGQGSWNTVMDAGAANQYVGSPTYAGSQAGYNSAWYGPNWTPPSVQEPVYKAPTFNAQLSSSLQSLVPNDVSKYGGSDRPLYSTMGSESKSVIGSQESVDESNEKIAEMRGDDERQKTPLGGVIESIAGMMCIDADTSGRVADGRVARSSAQGEDAPIVDFDTNALNEDDENKYRNPVDMIATDIIALQSFLPYVRESIGKALGFDPEIVTTVDGRDYSEEEMAKIRTSTPETRFVDNRADADYVNVYKDENGRYYTTEELNSSVLGRYADQPGDKVEGYTEEGYPLTDLDTLYFQDGSTMSVDSYNRMVENSLFIPIDQASDMDKTYGELIQFVYSDDDGNDLTWDDLGTTDMGGNATYRQENAGPLGIFKQSPQAPLRQDQEGNSYWDFSDFLPWMVDTAIQSAPYFNPVTGALLAGSNYSAWSEGYDPQTFDPLTYTFADDPLDSTQIMGGMLGSWAEPLSEKVGGIGSSAAGGTNLAKLINPLHYLDDYAAGRIASGTVDEALEEAMVAPFQAMQNYGSDAYKNYTVDAEGNRTYDDSTTSGQRFMNFLNDPDTINAMLAGGLLGGGAGTLSEIANADFRKARENRRTGKSDSSQWTDYGLPKSIEQDYLDAYNRMTEQDEDRKKEDER